MRLVERLETAIWTQTRITLNRYGRAKRHTLNRADQSLKGALVIDSVAVVNPRAHPEERLQDGRIELLGKPRQQHQEQAEIDVLGRPVECNTNLLVLPGAAIERTDEHRT